MGLMPKISVRVVPEASTSASMRPLRSAITGREHPHPCRELGRDVHDRLAGRRQPPRQVPTEPARVLHGPTTLGEPLRPALEAPQAFSRSCGKLALSTSSPLASSTAATATDALWGSTPISTFM